MTDLGYALLGLLQESTESTAPGWTLSDTQKLSDIGQKIAAIIAIGVGGVWAYFLFVRRRTFVSNLEPTISGVITRKDGAYQLLAEASVKNIGSSKININHENTGLRVYTQKAGEEMAEAGLVDWSDEPYTWPILEDQDLLEPGETVGDKLLIEMPDTQDLPLKLELWLASTPEEGWLASFIGNEESYWVAVNIVALASEETPPGQDTSGGAISEEEDTSGGVVLGEDIPGEDNGGG